MKSDYVRNEIYGGFQCYWNYLPTMISKSGKVEEMLKYLFRKTSVNITQPSYYSYPCCSTFFVRSDAIRMRPKSDYIQILKNVED